MVVGVGGRAIRKSLGTETTVALTSLSAKILQPTTIGLILRLRWRRRKRVSLGIGAPPKLIIGWPGAGRMSRPGIMAGRKIIAIGGACQY